MSAVTALRVQDLRPATYRLDPERSTVTYTGKHLFGLGTVHATFRVTSGELRIGEPVTESSASALVDAASFSSGNAKRDRDVRSRGLLDVERFPDIRFSSTAVRASRDDLFVNGTVTAHGRTVPVTLVVTSVCDDDGAIHVQGRATHLDRHDFGVTGSTGMVGRFLDLDLDVVAVRA